MATLARWKMPPGPGHPESDPVTYYGWKEGRTEIPYSRNWRGEWVADLKLKRIKRAILTGVAALFVAGVVLGFQAMSPDGPYADIPPAPINARYGSPAKAEQ